MKTPTILIVSNVPWNSLKQRPHFMVEYLSKKYHMIFFEPPDSFPKRLFLKNVIKKEADRILRLQNNRLLPFRPIMKSIQFIKINQIMNELFLKAYLNLKTDYIVITENYMYFDYKRLREHYKIQKVIYDCVDLMEYFDFKNMQVRLFFEKKLINIADYIIVVSGELEEKFKRYQHKMIKVSNGVDYDKFRKVYTLEREDIKGRVRKGYNYVLGYIGAIEEWFDFKIIQLLLEKHLDTRIILIGMMAQRVKKKYKKLKQQFGPRIDYEGIVPHDLIPFYIKYFDYGIIPFDIRHPVVKGVNPIKLYEYFAMGKSVIANIWDEIRPFHDNKKLISFESYIRDRIKIEMQIDQKLHQEKIDIAKNNNWPSKFKEILNLIESGESDGELRYLHNHC